MKDVRPLCLKVSIDSIVRLAPWKRRPNCTPGAVGPKASCRVDSELLAASWVSVSFYFLAGG